MPLDPVRNTPVSVQTASPRERWINYFPGVGHLFGASSTYQKEGDPTRRPFGEVVPSHGLRDHKSFSFNQLRLDNFAIVKLSHGYGDVSRLRVPSFASRPRDQSKIPGVQSPKLRNVPSFNSRTLDVGPWTPDSRASVRACPVPPSRPIKNPAWGRGSGSGGQSVLTLDPGQEVTVP